jgi:uncharacterized protein (DUF302 family)
VNQNRITLVKVCAPEVARLLWPLGPHVAAMLPCGNLSVYQRDGRTEISLLHARYMAVLYPHEATRQAAEVGQALFLDMVRAVAGAPN